MLVKFHDYVSGLLIILLSKPLHLNNIRCFDFHTSLLLKYFTLEEKFRVKSVTDWNWRANVWYQSG